MKESTTDLGSIEICILAGGLSSRMGSDKAKLRLGTKSLLGHVRAKARQAGYPLRVIRRDLVARCGPLGGIFTALTTSKTENVLFLSCDMPFVPVVLLNRLIRNAKPDRVDAVFVSTERDRVGFPICIKRRCIDSVRELLCQSKPSLQELASRVASKLISIGNSEAEKMLNVNTPADFKWAEEIWSRIRNEKC